MAEANEDMPPGWYYAALFAVTPAVSFLSAVAVAGFVGWLRPLPKGVPYWKYYGLVLQAFTLAPLAVLALSAGIVCLGNLLGWSRRKTATRWAWLAPLAVLVVDLALNKIYGPL